MNLNLIIKEYFYIQPIYRPPLSKSISKYINDPQDVLLILDWGINKGITEGWDSAIDILSECGELLTRALDILKNKQLSREEELEVLITSIGLCNNLSAESRLEVISELIPSERRLIKTAIIDTLVRLSDDISSDIIRPYLNSYLSPLEKDEYIQLYAKEAIEELI